MPQPLTCLDDALSLCQQENLRLSRQRRAILALLWQTEGHLSARDIYDRLNQQGQPIGQTSVYQNLDVLARHRVIECFEHMSGRRYGRRNDRHSHMHCVESERVNDIDVNLPEAVLAAVAAQTNMEIQGYRIDFYGIPRATIKNGNPTP
ncbi:MAG: transcriptional repressor [Synechococcaceae cyanobacterium SM2_3_60]|nr:transcriptional repressor [Synechococcaceae cyanobacterium SM2_3_60]